jgi:hypothetical protein
MGRMEGCHERRWRDVKSLSSGLCLLKRLACYYIALIFQIPPRVCRNWHHGIRVRLRLVAEVSQGRSLHLSR